ncbi:hypothetical protein BC827DRAFT_550104 [Russula dissimulans]|nr:hypothetical protein BC827DRAFT_550104 [Russula dissimulans]
MNDQEVNQLLLYTIVSTCSVEMKIYCIFVCVCVCVCIYIYCLVDNIVKVPWPVCLLPAKLIMYATPLALCPYRWVEAQNRMFLRPMRCVRAQSVRGLASESDASSGRQVLLPGRPPSFHPRACHSSLLLTVSRTSQMLLASPRVQRQTGMQPN